MAKQVQELIERGKLAEREGRRDDARRMFEEALHALGTSTHAATASALLRWVGRTYHTDGDHTAALGRGPGTTLCSDASRDGGAVWWNNASLSHPIPGTLQ